MFLAWVFRIGGISLISTFVLVVLTALLAGFNVVNESSALIELGLRVADVLLIAGGIGGVVLLPNAIKQVWRKRGSMPAPAIAGLCVIVICFFAFSGYFLYARTDTGVGA